nr:MAG TPA: hypothetical protein [Caudoviricetes sp.]
MTCHTTWSDNETRSHTIKPPLGGFSLRVMILPRR